MQQQTSRMYGIKVKETRDWFDFHDIRLLYDKENKEWKLKSLCDNLWYNGKNYKIGEYIDPDNLHLHEGGEFLLRMMAQYENEETGKYDNWMYDIIGNAVGEVSYGEGDIKYKIVTSDTDPSFYGLVTVYKYEGGIIKSTKKFTYKNINNHKAVWGEDSYYKAFNLYFDYIKEDDPHEPMHFKCIANGDYLSYNDTHYQINQVIKSWSATTQESFEIKDDINRHKVKSYDKNVCPPITLRRRCGSTKEPVVKDRESIVTYVYHDHKDVYYNGHHHKAMYLVYDNSYATSCWAKTFGKMFAVTYADPYWFLMCIKDDLIIGSVRHKKNDLLASWKEGETISLSGTYKQVKKIPKAKGAKYDKVLYDIQCSTSDDSITITRLFNNEPKESRTFSPADVRVRFENLEFVLNGEMWTIYSKCDFIHYDGKTYVDGKPIFSFPISDDFHIQIEDQSNMYMIESITRYDVNTETIVSTTYRVWTSEIDRTIKIEKTRNGKVEPWESVRYYDVLYKNFKYDALVIDFDYYTKKWSLISNSDEFYCEGTNYKKNETVAEWGYYDIVKFNYITVLGTTPGGVRFDSTFIKSSGEDYVSNDLDEEITYDNLGMIKILYSSTKGYWELRSLNDYCWCEGTNYTTDEVIMSFKNREIIEDTTIMFQIPEPFMNLVYQVYTSVDVINDVTNFSISQVGGNAVTFSSKKKLTDETKSYTTEEAKSLYGYIWQRAPEPTPPPIPSAYLLMALYDMHTNFKSAFTKVYPGGLIPKIAVSQTTPLHQNTTGGEYFKRTVSNTEYLFWTERIGLPPLYTILNYGNSVIYTRFHDGTSYINLDFCVLLQNGSEIVFTYAESRDLYKGTYTVDFGDNECVIRIYNIESLDYEFSYGVSYTTFVTSNYSFSCIALAGFNNQYDIGFKYISGEILPIVANGEDLESLRLYCRSHYQFDFIPSGFELPCQFEESILMYCQVYRIRSDWWSNITTAWYGTIIARYDIVNNEMEYYDRFGIKERYTKIYKFEGDTYLQTDGAHWNYLDTDSGLIKLDGDKDLHVYKLEDENIYLNMGVMADRTIFREVTETGIPSPITPKVEIRRLDSDEPIEISLFQGTPIDTMSVNIIPSYDNYSDKLVLLLNYHSKNVIAIMNSPYWDSGGNADFAWELENYGIDEDYNN